MDSILTSIKKLLGIEEDYEHFDVDIIIHINSVFAILTQLGIGPEKGFSIQDANATWDEFISDNQELLNTVKSYMYLKVKLMFDVPSSSAVINSMNSIIGEFEWRLHVAADQIKTANSDSE